MHQQVLLRAAKATDSVCWHWPPCRLCHPGSARPQVRLAGDRYVFLEYGPMELDIKLRVR